MRYRLKVVAVWIAHLVTWPLAIPAILDYKLWKSERMFDFSAKLLSLMPGRIGQYLRTSFYMQTLSECHYDLYIGFASFFSHITAEVGRDVKIGSFSIVGTAALHDHVVIGSRVSILSGKYQHGGGNRGRDLRNNSLQFERVTIGANTWLGEGSVVMANVGSDCIVSAGSVVTKPVPDGMTAVGNPARFVNFGERRPAYREALRTDGSTALAYVLPILFAGALIAFHAPRADSSAYVGVDKVADSNTAAHAGGDADPPKKPLARMRHDAVAMSPLPVVQRIKQ